MRRVGDCIRKYASALEREGPKPMSRSQVRGMCNYLRKLADDVDRDHASRISQSRHHVWHAAMRDIRYCANELERKRNRRDVARKAKRKGA